MKKGQLYFKKERTLFRRGNNGVFNLKSGDKWKRPLWGQGPFLGWLWRIN